MWVGLLWGLSVAHAFGMGFTFCVMYSSPETWAGLSFCRIVLGVVFWEILWGHGVYCGLFRHLE